MKALLTVMNMKAVLLLLLGILTLDGRTIDIRSHGAKGDGQALTLEDVRLSLAADDLRPVVHAERVERLTLDNFKFPRLPGVAEPIVTTNVGKILKTP